MKEHRFPYQQHSICSLFLYGLSWWFGYFTLNYNFSNTSSAGIPYITAGDAQQSYLWHKINGTQSSVGGGGSNMANKPGVNLSSSDFDLIEAWIQAGALP